MRTIQITALALIVGAGVACKSKSDSGESGVTGTTATATPGTTGTPAVGDGTGSYGLTIEATCSILWNIAGTYTGSGADYSWDAALTGNSGDCSGVEDTSGSLTASGGSAYFAGNYIGTAAYAGTTLSWSTAGYVTGGAGGSYAYDGNITW